MREHRFLVPERITLRYILESKRSSHGLLAVDPAASVRSAIDLMTGSNVSSADELAQAAIAHLSQTHHAVLVEDAGRMIGILTRYDVIEHMSR